MTVPVKSRKFILDAPIDFEGESDLPRLKKAYNALKEDSDFAFSELNALATAGSRMSMAYLAHAYEVGCGMKIDLAMAEMWYLKAYEAGSLSALISLSYLYLRTAEFKKSEIILQNGVERGYSLAFYMLGRIYVFGPGDFGNRKEGLRLLENAAAMGNLYAKRDFGYLLSKGEFGIFGRIKGAFIYIDGFIKLLRLAWTHPHSPKLKQYGIY